ncbi:hypothetical protein HZS_1234 [Henneguya salminicola]|nr:hypothetical protein HZS_1234 [Henneguya salminicola]
MTFFYPCSFIPVYVFEKIKTFNCPTKALRNFRTTPYIILYDGTLEKLVLLLLFLQINYECEANPRLNDITSPWCASSGKKYHVFSQI